MNFDFYTKDKSVEKVKESIYSDIKLLVIDVDGTMTDGGIYYDNAGSEIKKFNTKDAAGFFAARVCNIKIMILTGRESAAVLRRMTELKADYIIQNVQNKKEYLIKFLAENNLEKCNLGYIGDDFNDYECMKLAGFVGCPLDAEEDIKKIATYVSLNKGGYGAVRDCIQYLLTERGQWETAINMCYGITR